MANLNAPQGFRVHEANYKHTRVFHIPASDGTAIGIGDPVDLAGSSDANGIPSVTLATAGSSNSILGHVIGLSSSAPNGRDGIVLNTDINYRPASTLRYVAVCTDPLAILEVQCNAALVAGDIGLNANFVAGTPSSTYGNSTAQLDVSSKGTGETLQYRILSLFDGDEFGTYNRALVMVNTHRYNGQTLGE